MNMSWQSVPRSVSLIGPAKTKRMFLLAEKVASQQAVEWGWADFQSESGQALTVALSLAEQLAAKPQNAIRMCKQAINVSANALNHIASFMDADQMLLLQHSEEYAEALDKFFNKSAE